MFFFLFFFCYSTNITVEFPERVVSYVMVVVKNPKTEAKLQVCMYLLGMYVSFLYVFLWLTETGTLSIIMLCSLHQQHPQVLQDHKQLQVV